MSKIIEVIEFTKENLDYIRDMAQFYEETPELDENERVKYRYIAKVCEEKLK